MEPTFGWLMQHRRLVRGYEALPPVADAATEVGLLRHHHEWCVSKD
nr:hypothetical protein [Micromonospora nigra]